VEFVVDKVALGQVLIRVFRFYPANIIPPVFPTLVYEYTAVFLKRLATVDHFIPNTQKCMQVNRRNIIPVVNVAMTTLIPNTNLKHLLKQ
jgi:hypothetical protein